jgi:hypothetical protein
VIERRVEFGHAAIEVAQLRRLICGTRVNFSSRRLPDALPAHQPARAVSLSGAGE